MDGDHSVSTSIVGGLS